jgi:GMP reductase
MRIEEEIKLDYQDVLLRPKRSTLTSRKDVALERMFKFYHSPRTWTGLPIMTANMATCGTFEMANILHTHQIITTFHKYYTVEEYQAYFAGMSADARAQIGNYIAFTIGIRDEDLTKLAAMEAAGLMQHFAFICIDVPNGYLQRFTDTIKLVREKFPTHIIIAGNVVTNEMTEEIILSGADIVKVGIGPGSACTTRRMTGVGYPQLSAVIECADAAHGLHSGQGCGLIIADGGQQYPSCVAKAFAAGADFNMFGSMFSGFEESAGETVEKNGVLYKEYFGSSSNHAMEKLYGKKDAHRASEGRYTLIPHKGSIHTFLQDLCGALRSTGTYIGAGSLKEFAKRATFVRVNRQLNQSLERFDQGG